MAAAGSEPEPESEPRAATPAPSSPDDDWVPPVTFSDRFSVASRALLRAAAAVVGVGTLVVVALWAVPTLVVSRSATYAALAERARADRGLRSLLGTPLEVARIPARYRVEGEGTGRYEFLVSGPLGRARVEAEVREGEVVKWETAFALDSYY